MSDEKKPAQRGRPEVPELLRRELVTMRLPRWLADWLSSQPDSAGAVVESALVSRHKLKAPKP